MRTLQSSQMAELYPSLLSLHIRSSDIVLDPVTHLAAFQFFSGIFLLPEHIYCKCVERIELVHKAEWN